ncbi:ABC transporter permease [Spirosoma sp. KUDC1026]|uniref:ABC transporter permease n=1 Tax=Spirosoma sp. KUDC1026 TaxID=2745947 RepID=UPI00159BF08F|nr:ABC transporter permease [Spirosoma sp. KUDC1026]QKZ12803.1 ABC transporter permease [Spirosoma sp. KUDC1026]
MLRNYLKIAWRHLLQRRFYSLLNITGLAAGLAFFLLIGSYIWSEFQVNRQLRQADRHYLVQSHWKDENMGIAFTTLAPLGPALKAQYPTLVANFYRFYGASATLSKGTTQARESMQIGDSTLLAMYGFPLLHGDPRTALSGPNSMVITAAKAMRYFGRTDVINESLQVETTAAGKQTFLITGVLAPLPANSVSNLLTEKNEIFMPLSSLRYFFGGEGPMSSWLNQYIVTYVELQPGVSAQSLEKPLAQLIKTNTPADIQKNLTAYVTPLTDYYLQSNNGLIRKMIITLASVAVFILLMAVVNFVNMSMGSSSSRLREIGVRKALGGLRQQLTVQFLLEALTLTTLSAGLSLVLYVLFRPLFSDVVGKTIPSLQSLPWQYGLVIVGLLLVIGILAGAYPALRLSAYSSTDSLKGKEKSVAEGAWLRRSLVTVQFTIAIFVFVGAIIVSQQIAYFFDTDLGFKKEAVLTVSSLPRDWSAKGVARMEVARDQLARLPGIQAASLSFEIPNGNIGNSGNLYREGRDSTQGASVQLMTTDQYFAQTYQIPLRSGRYFNQDHSGYDSTSLVINEAAVRALGYKTAEAAIGQSVRIQNFPQSFQIGGVVQDFHVNTMHEAIRPLAIAQVQQASIYRFFSFRIAPGRTRQTLAGIEQKWRTLFPDAPFDYAFMDQTLQRLYQTELQLEKAAYVATGLALLIVILGVVGLVSLSVTRRTKEVGIRKVLGASVPNIVFLFVKEYAWIMVVANALAWPLAYWLLTNWLADYAYHETLGWLPFLQVGLVLTLLTGIVISVQVIKAALMNPVKSLRID